MKKLSDCFLENLAYAGMIPAVGDALSLLLEALDEFQAEVNARYTLIESRLNSIKTQQPSLGPWWARKSPYELSRRK